jgi:hypothetical protein
MAVFISVFETCVLRAALSSVILVAKRRLHGEDVVHAQALSGRRA